MVLLAPASNKPDKGRTSNMACPRVAFAPPRPRPNDNKQQQQQKAVNNTDGGGDGKRGKTRRSSRRKNGKNQQVRPNAAAAPTLSLTLTPAADTTVTATRSKRRSKVFFCVMNTLEVPVVILCSRCIMLPPRPSPMQLPVESGRLACQEVTVIGQGIAMRVDRRGDPTSGIFLTSDQVLDGVAELPGVYVQRDHKIEVAVTRIQVAWRERQRRSTRIKAANKLARMNSDNCNALTQPSQQVASSELLTLAFPHCG